MMSRWGEIPLDPDTEPGIAAIEREQITKPRPMELDGPLLHQPVKQEQAGPLDIPIECAFGDALVTQSIALNQQAKKMRTLLNNLQQQQDNPQKQCDSEDISAQFLQLLETTEAELPHKNLSSNKYFESKFRQGIGEAPPEISDQLAKKILRKALAVMCAHAGFETTTESVLETLVDVTNEFYLKLTHLLRGAVDREALVGGPSFPDVLEQVFYEIGIGSMHNLNTFYQTRVIKYHNHLLQTCQQLKAEYKQFKFPETAKEPEENKNVEIKEEVVPQIHFPTTDDQEDAHHPDASMHLDELHNLQVTFEQETAHVDAEDDVSKSDQAARNDLMLSLPTTNVPNLDTGEEIVNVIDSPVHPHESELMTDSQLSSVLESQHSPVTLGMKMFKSKTKL